MFESSSVIELNNSNIQERKVFPTPQRYGLLFVYADWCRFCQQTKPDILRAANTLKSQGFPVFALNEQFKQALNQLDVVSFPTIFIVFPNGSLRQYKGPRDDASLVKLVRYQSGTSLQKAKSNNDDSCHIM